MMPLGPGTTWKGYALRKGLFSWTQARWEQRLSVARTSSSQEKQDIHPFIHIHGLHSGDIMLSKTDLSLTLQAVSYIFQFENVGN